MTRSDELLALADAPFTGAVTNAVVLTPDFARDIADLLATTPPAPSEIDVERLARAYINHHAPWYNGEPDRETFRQAREWAAKIAAEYAKAEPE